MANKRIPIAALALSAVALVGLVIDENYTSKAIIPTKGDRPTVGFGSTFRPDGSRVQMGDTVTPPRALTWALVHIGKDEAKIKQCVTAPLYQAEYDLLIQHSYQYGVAATCASKMVKLINAGDYRASCEAYTDYRYMTSRKALTGWEQYQQGRWRYDCSTPGNKQCRGVWLRSLALRDACRAAQGGK